jgi:hypothetical protein
MAVYEIVGEGSEELYDKIYHKLPTNIIDLTINSSPLGDLEPGCIVPAQELPSADENCSQEISFNIQRFDEPLDTIKTKSGHHFLVQIVVGRFIKPPEGVEPYNNAILELPLDSGSAAVIKTI